MLNSAILSRAGGRDQNQDVVEAAQVGRCYCWCLADGLGGHRGGKRAAELAVSGALDAFRAGPEASPAAVTRCIDAANAAVVTAQQGDPDLVRMRATLVILIADRQHAAWGHVGDSRLYRIEGGRVGHRTKDHSVTQALIDAGELSVSQHARHEDRDRILRAVGDRKGVASTVVDVSEPLHRRDAFLLCTDGFWEAVSDLAIEIDLAATLSASDWIRRMEHRVMAHVTSGSDNYSAIAVRFDESAPLPEPRDIDAFAVTEERDDETGPVPATDDHPRRPGTGVRAWMAGVGMAVLGGVLLWQFVGDSPVVPTESPRADPEAVPTLPDAPSGSAISPAALEPGQILVVEEDAFFQRLDEAINDAPPAARIWLGPGRYELEGRIVDHELHLQGAGADQTTVDLLGSPGLTVTAAAGSIVDLTLCCAEGGPVLTLGGQFAGTVASAVISGGATSGMLVADAATPTIDHVEFVGNVGEQLMIAETATPVLIGIPDVTADARPEAER